MESIAFDNNVKELINDVFRQYQDINRVGIDDNLRIAAIAMESRYTKELDGVNRSEAF